MRFRLNRWVFIFHLKFVCTELVIGETYHDAECMEKFPILDLYSFNYSTYATSLRSCLPYTVHIHVYVLSSSFFHLMTLSCLNLALCDAVIALTISWILYDSFMQCGLGVKWGFIVMDTHCRTRTVIWLIDLQIRYCLRM